MQYFRDQIKQSKYLAILVILLASVLTHFIFFGHPSQVVFDEVHFGGFAQGYFSGEYYFDIHPPLGKLLIAGIGWLFGYDPSVDYANIGNDYPNNLYIVLRLLPTLAGVLLPLVLYKLGRELHFSQLASFSLGMLIILENALLVQSKFILLDAFLLLFGFTALLLYLRYRNHGALINLIGAFVFAGLAISIKWTGLSFLGIIGIFEIIRRLRLSWKQLIGLVGLSAITLATYFSFFVIHFALLDKNGPGVGFMSPQFQQTLENNQFADNQDITPWPDNPVLVSMLKFVDLNTAMHRANAGLSATHPYSTNPEVGPRYDFYTWPLMIRPIFYWSDNLTASEFEDGIARSARIYLLGNPIIWWASAFAILYFIIYIVSEARHIHKHKKPWDMLGIILVFAYLVNIVPFAPVTRSLFLYHYFPALIIAIIALVYMIDKLNNKRAVFATLLTISLVSFVFFAPLTYGTAQTPTEYETRMWLNSWK